MPYRKVPLVKQKIYHIFSKSIANFKIFNSEWDFDRMLQTISYYTLEKTPCKFSLFLKHKEKSKEIDFSQFSYSQKIVRILAYCLMPTHIHLLLMQLKDDGISRFVNLILKSYTKYFNTKYNRKGPLWEARFKNVLINTSEQFLHLTRYIHLNPTSAFLVNKPEDWEFSSYREYIGLIKERERIDEFSDYWNTDITSYKKFVEERIDYQRELERIKNLVLE
jgi:putative transposase